MKLITILLCRLIKEALFGVIISHLLYMYLDYREFMLKLEKKLKRIILIVFSVFESVEIFELSTYKRIPM